MNSTLIKVFKVFLQLKWEEITDAFVDFWNGCIIDEVYPILKSVAIVALCLFGAYWVFYAIGYGLEAFNLQGDCNVNGYYALFGLFNVVFVAVIGFVAWKLVDGAYKFIRWIQSNWREAKRRVEGM
jgi:hypothetical protein